MGYDYYCMYCGRKNSQETVLFDMQYLLTGDTTKTLSIIKYRMTIQQLRSLLRRGTPGENGYIDCSLSMDEVMAIVSNANNLKDELLAKLTLKQVDAYLEEEQRHTFSGAGSEPQQEDSFGSFGSSASSVPVSVSNFRSLVTS